jgi:putative acetyltransferase
MDMVPLLLRESDLSDRPAIADLIVAAFGPAEGAEIVQLVERLSSDATAQPVLSLVAVRDGRVVGHVMLTRARVDGAARGVSAAILAPLAVHPDFQSQGIGGQLVTEGLRQLSDAGVDLVFVLGHPDYYPRLGFSEAGLMGLDAPYSMPPRNAGAWMVKPLRPGILGAVKGRVLCAVALDDPRYWRE